MKARLTILTVIIASGLILACAVPNLRPQREAAVTSTPTRTPKPTFTATITATTTLTPSATPTLTNTPTNTPVPTQTPIPTDTPPPTLTPTETPIPSSTPTSPPTVPPTATKKPTPRPTRRPTKVPTPRPTQPPPPPFQVDILRGHPHCGGYAGVTGTVTHANSAPYPGVAIGVWSGDWPGRVGISEADGKFEVPLSDLPPGHYQVAVVELGSCSVNESGPTAVDCQRLSNQREVTVTEFCEVNRVTELRVTGP